MTIEIQPSINVKTAIRKPAGSPQLQTRSHSPSNIGRDFAVGSAIALSVTTCSLGGLLYFKTQPAKKN